MRNNMGAGMREKGTSIAVHIFVHNVWPGLKEGTPTREQVRNNMREGTSVAVYIRTQCGQV